MEEMSEKSKEKISGKKNETTNVYTTVLPSATTKFYYTYGNQECRQQIFLSCFICQWNGFAIVLKWTQWNVLLNGSIWVDRFLGWLQLIHF